MCQRSIDPIYIVTYYIKWDTQYYNNCLSVIKINHSALMVCAKTMWVREAAKNNVLFFSCPAFKRGGGKGLATKKMPFFEALYKILEK